MSAYTDIQTKDSSNNFGEILINDFVIEARAVQIGFIRTSPTTMEVTVNFPDRRKAIDGAVVVISESDLTISNAPQQGSRYAGSTNYSSPVSTIGNAKVLFARYQAFGDVLNDIETFTITNIPNDKPYFLAVHACTNSLVYYQYGIHSYPIVNDDLPCLPPTHSGSIPSSCTPPTNPNVGYVFHNIADNSVQMWTGTMWVPAGTGTALSGPTSKRPITTPTYTLVPGTFYYDTDLSVLEIWNGTSWNAANTENRGAAMYDKIRIGTDGTYDERLALADILRGQMGYPQLCVELDENQFNIAIDNAIEEFRRRADNAYLQKFIMLPLVNGQQLYYLNDPVRGTDKIVDIIKIHRVNIFNLQSASNSIDSGFIINSLLGAMYGHEGMFDILSVQLVTMMGEEYERIFAGNLMFNFNENTRELQLYRNIQSNESVLLECVVERTEQDLLKDRFAKQWLQGWAVSELLFMLGMIRSKYGTLPGPNGGITLNGSELLTMWETQQTELLRQITDYEVGNGGVNFGNTTVFLM